MTIKSLKKRESELANSKRQLEILSNGIFKNGGLPKFANKIAELADLEDHHPKITVEWGIVGLEWWSHKIKGLHMNDFICASKSDYLYESN